MQNSRKRIERRWRTKASNLLVVVCWLALGATSNAQSLLKVTENPDGFLITEGNTAVLQYQLKNKSLNGKFARSNYVHPLNDLDGQPVTEDFPEDHRHHRGIFWAWHQVWVGDQKIGDPWLCQDFEWLTTERSWNDNADGSVSVSAKVIWRSPKFLAEDGRFLPIAEEAVQITVFPSTESYRIVEFKLAFKALQADVRIGGSEDTKGYGGFSPRIKLNEHQQFTSNGGDVEPVKTAIDAGPWVNITNGKVGVAILTHPANPGSPEPWILRRTRSMQNARFPGAVPFRLPNETRLVQRYQLVIHRGTSVNMPLEELHKNFANSNR